MGHKLLEILKSKNVKKHKVMKYITLHLALKL